MISNKIQYFLMILIIIFMLYLVYISFLMFKTSYFSDLSNQIDMRVNGSSIIKVEPNQEYNDQGAVFKINNYSQDITTKNINFDNTISGINVISYYFTIHDLIIAKYRLIEIVSDTPTIVLNGSTEITHTINTKYIEPGYYVIDNNDDDLNDKVVITSDLNVNEEGTYTIKYSITDRDNNFFTVERKITVTKDKKLSNYVISASFVDNGIKLFGYVRDANNNYQLQLCNSVYCQGQLLSNIDQNKYTGIIDLTTIPNGKYRLKIKSHYLMDIINKLPEPKRIIRSKIGDKLVTIDYDNDNMNIIITNFKYEYDILIDPGHGGNDPGAINESIQEKELNLMQSLYEKKRYEEHGLKVLMIREDDSNGLAYGSNSNSLINQRALAIAYYGAVSKISYSNHHNSISNPYYSGWEIIAPSALNSTELVTENKIASAFEEVYPLNETHIRFYTRNYQTGAILSKNTGEIYDIVNWYAVIRIPYELSNVKNVLYEGCYLSNYDDFNWYYNENNWLYLSEIKIKYYVESLGIKYISKDLAT